MQNYFDNELLNIERELTQLKTGTVKSAAVIDSISKTINISVPLSISSSGLVATGEKNYRVSLPKPSIVISTLDWYHGDVTKEWEAQRTSRRARIHQMDFPNGDTGITIVITGTDYSTNNTDDLSRLKNGESVSVPVQLTVTCTNDFNLEEI